MLYDLENTALFQDLSHEDLNAIAKFCRREVLADGDVIIHENERTGHDIFILCKGAVEVVSNQTNMLSGEAVLSPETKELFGEISWLTKSRRTASVRAKGPVEVIRVEGARLDAYMTQHPQAGFAIMRRIATLLSQRLSETDTLLKQILWNTGI